MLEVRNVRVSYEGQPLLTGVSFAVRRNETACLLGPSGSGKSTLLQIIAGLQVPETGTVLWAGKDLGAMPAHLRDFGLVFQDYALFPHLDVFHNVAFGLNMRGWKPPEVRGRVEDVLQLVDLAGFERRAVTDLSGGEQQRVALARALAPRPRLLMFDEPLGALDRTLREDLLIQLREILRRTRIPSLYVTHDQEEAFRIADKILLLHGGHIVQAGTPQQVWDHPESAWVAHFLGLGNIFTGKVISGGKRVQTEHGVLSFRCKHTHRKGDKIQLLGRPTPASQGSQLQGVVKETIFQNDKYRVLLDGDLYFDTQVPPRVGQRVRIRLGLECLGDVRSA
jgi:ABC-type Fe3+/spermidine/putrescine transport system ATPase subunit